MRADHGIRAKMTQRDGNHAACRTRRRLRPDDRVALILAAAFEEFAAKGFGSARMEAVAEHAGITKGLVYHYFPTKAELFGAVVRWAVQPVFEPAEAQVATFQGTRRALLVAMIRNIYESVGKNEREHVLFRMVLAEGERFPELARFYHDAVFARGDALLRTIIEAGIAAGEFRAAGYRHFPPLIVSPVVLAGAFGQLAKELPPLDLDAMLEAHIDLLMNGLLPRGDA